MTLENLKRLRDSFKQQGRVEELKDVEAAIALKEPPAPKPVIKPKKVKDGS